jgi:hypothetical protein
MVRPIMPVVGLNPPGIRTGPCLSKTWTILMARHVCGDLIASNKLAETALLIKALTRVNPAATKAHAQLLDPMP